MCPAGWSETVVPLRLIRSPYSRPESDAPGSSRARQHPNSLRGGQVRTRAPGGVVAVGVGDDGPVHRLPRIDEEVTGLAVEAAAGEAEEGMLKSRRGSGAAGQKRVSRREHSRASGCSRSSWQRRRPISRSLGMTASAARYTPRCPAAPLTAYARTSPSALPVPRCAGPWPFPVRPGWRRAAG